MRSCRTLMVAGLMSLGTAALMVIGGAQSAAAGGHEKSRAYSKAPHRYDRARPHQSRRYRSPRYDLEDGMTGIAPSDIDLNAPGGPELLFEIIRRNSL